MNKAIWVVLGCLLVGGSAVYVLFWGSKPAPATSPEVVVSPTSEVVQEASGSPIKEETPMSTPTATAAQKQTSWSSPPAMAVDSKKKYTATIVTNKGTMKVGLFVSEAPVTVNNFVFLARQGFYDNTIFHRIIKGFMIQGGDPQGTGMGGPGYKFNDEPVTRDYTRGTLAMANAGPNTNGSQFFIMHANYALPKNYVIFGSIDAADAESLKTLDAIASTQVGTSGSGEQSKPLETITVSSVTIVEG